MADERATAAVLAEPICPCGHPVREHPHPFPGNAYCRDCRRGWVDALLASDWLAAHVAAAIAAIPGDDAARALDEVERRVRVMFLGEQPSESEDWQGKFGGLVNRPAVVMRVERIIREVRAAHAAGFLPDEPQHLGRVWTAATRDSATTGAGEGDG